VIQGTGGLRKLRFSPPSWNKGKRSATRVAFVYLELHSIVLLMSVYSKGEKLNITPQERVVYKKTISQIRKNLRGDAT
jgi:hypothetical protein